MPLPVAPTENEALPDASAAASKAGVVIVGPADTVSAAPADVIAEFCVVTAVAV